MKKLFSWGVLKNRLKFATFTLINIFTGVLWRLFQMFSKWLAVDNHCNPISGLLIHETIIWTGIIGKEIFCFMHGSACKWCIIEKAKLSWSFNKHSTREKCLNTELFPVRIESKYRKIRTRNNSVFENFSHSDFWINPLVRITDSGLDYVNELSWIARLHYLTRIIQRSSRFFFLIFSFSHGDKAL